MITCNLRDIMHVRDLTIQDVADTTGLSRTTISALVNNDGKGVSFKVVDILCEKLNITFGDLFSADKRTFNPPSKSSTTSELLEEALLPVKYRARALLLLEELRSRL